MNSFSYSIQRKIHQALSPLRIPEPKNLCEWAEDNFYLSAESSYVEGSFTAIPWQRGIMNVISNDDVRIIDWIKSARVGATKIMLASTGYFAEHKKRNQLFFQPTNEDAEDFCKTEVDTMLRDVACMRDIFPDLGKKSKNNTQVLKQFIGSSLRVKGGKTGGNYRRVSVDVVYYDELENFDRDVGGEGSPLMLGDKRLEGSIFPKSIRMTTPKIKLGSLIEGEVKNAHCYFKYHVPCPHCGEEQVLKWGGRDSDYGFKWDGDDPESCYYMCEHEDCHAVIRNNDLTYMNEHGVWRDENTGVWLDEEFFFRDSNGTYIATPKHVAFHIWTAYSPFVQWSQFVSEFIIAQKLVKEDGDVSKLKTFVNTTLGETWADASETDKLEPATLHNRREHYPEKGFSKRGLVLMGGFDMQDDRIEGEIRAWGLNNESWLVDYFILRGDPAQPELWDKLHERVLKTYKRENGDELPISRICFDSGGHYTTEVYEFSKRAGIHTVIPTKGASTYDEPLISYPRKTTKHGVYLTMIGTDTAKDVLYSRLRLTTDDLTKPTGGFYHFPIADWCDLTYFKQLCAEWKVPKKTARGMRMVYSAGDRRNEPVDCSVGTLAALKISIDHYGLHLESEAEKVAYPDRDVSVDSDFLSAARRLKAS